MSLKEFTGSREQVITEGEFLPIVEKAASHLLELRVIVRTGAGTQWSRRFVSVHGRPTRRALVALLRWSGRLPR